MAAAEARQRVLVELVQVLAGHRHRAGVGPLQPGHHHQQRGFAGAGRPDQANRLAAAYIEVDVFEDMNAGGALPEREIDAGKRDRRPRLGRCFHVALPFTTPLIWGKPGRRPAPCGAAADGAGLCWRRPAPAPPTRPVKIVVLGDSLTAGYGLPADALSGQARAGAQGQGHRGRPSPMPACPAIPRRGGLGRLDWSVPEGTDAVIVELGANDCLRGIDPKLTKAALDDILTKLAARHISVLLAGMKAPRNMGADYVRELRRHLSGACLDSSGRLLSVLPRRRGRRSQAQPGRRHAPERRRRRRDRGAYPAAGRGS